MPKLSWRIRRLRAMSGAEVCWRLVGKIRESVDRCLLPLRRQPPSLARIASQNGERVGVRHEVVGSHLLDGRDLTTAFCEAGPYVSAAVAKADAISRNRLDLFDLEEHDLGPAVDWNYEYKAGLKAPMGYAATIDYRDYRVTGDCKFVWEPNRHQHLVSLARAYRFTGRREYAEAVLKHIDSWIEQCPRGLGMNWRSPLELGIRIINWVWAVELIRPSGLVDSPCLERLLPVVYCHLEHIARRYSRYSSANNHLVGEAAGVYIGSSYFVSLRRCRRWRKESREILSQEILQQTHADGGTREQAMGYHLFVLEFFMLCEIVARNLGEEFAPAYRHRLERMCEFLAAFIEGGGSLPMFGDSDDGCVLNLGDQADRARALLATAAVLFERADFKVLTPKFPETLFWLLGPEGSEKFDAMEAGSADGPLSSRVLADSGYYLLQSGSRESGDRISVGFDCGGLGYGTIAAHGHADALSFTLRAFDTDVCIDPGTYDYFTYPVWRDYFRSTRAHNTVVVDDRDQSEMLGSFLWGRRARARCLQWEPSPYGGTVTGEHDGYRVLSDPVHHRRTVSLDGRRGEVCVQDQLRGAAQHTATFCLHLAEPWSLIDTSGHRYTFATGQMRVVIELDDRLRVDIRRGSENPIAGWVSRGYHRRKPAFALMGRCAWQGRLALLTRISVVRNSSIEVDRAGDRAADPGRIASTE